jgi:1-acyl-sn-glycerol-3-phosphate acyltransferase
MHLRTLIAALFFFLAVLAIIPLFLVCLIFRLREPLLTYARGVLRAGRFILGLRVRVTGRENLSGRTPRVYMANHVSFLDGLLLFIFVPDRLRVILKKSLFRFPILGPGMRYAGFVPVDRRGARAGKASIETAAARMRSEGLSFLIFPEGTRSGDGKVQAFRRGGFFLALGAGAPIVPVSIRGAFRIMPRGRWVPRRGSIEIVFHPPVETAGVSPENMDGLMEKVRTAVAGGLEGDCHD